MKACWRNGVQDCCWPKGLTGSFESPNVGTEPARLFKLGRREKVTTSIKTWDNVSPTHWKNKKAKPDYVKALSRMSKNSAVCVSILRLFNINWCYLTPHASAEGMLFWAHRTCMLIWKGKHLFAFFSEKWIQGRENMISLVAFYLFPGSSMCHKETSKNVFLLEQTGLWGRGWSKALKTSQLLKPFATLHHKFLVLRIWALWKPPGNLIMFLLS